MKERGIVKELILHGFKTYYKTTVIKTAWTEVENRLIVTREEKGGD